MPTESMGPEVEVEEVITHHVPANNGAGPLWCYGSPAIIRNGESVYLSIPETDPAMERLCNTRWQLYFRNDDGWKAVRHGDYHDEREPCPLVMLPGGKLGMSVNPLLDPQSEDRSGPCLPHLLEFETADLSAPPAERMPEWDKDYSSFCEHSYRGVGLDAANDLVLMLNIDGHEGYAWSLMASGGTWLRSGHFSFPIRACYPQVGMHKGSAHIMAVGDILETNEEWRDFKREQTGRDWDYDFRRLFYTWTPDIRTEEFQAPIEIDSFEETAGYIRNLDMWIDPDGAVHLLYASRNIWHDFMRDEFFPKEPFVSRLEYRVLNDGVIVTGRTLAVHTKDELNPDDTGPYFTAGAFHVASDGTLRVIFTPKDAGMWLMQVAPESNDPPSYIDIKKPLLSFAAPANRNGSTAGDHIDLYGTTEEPNALSYVRLRL